MTYTYAVPYRATITKVWLDESFVDDNKSLALGEPSS